MSYPLVSEKYQWPSLVSPEQLVKPEEVDIFPARAVLCFSHTVARSLKKIQFFKKTISSSNMGYIIDLYEKKKSKKKEVCVAVVSCFGMGAPASVLCLEQLRALGVKEFISVGMVGSLNLDLKIGDKVFLKRSFRDEGCSYHYKAPSPYTEIPESETCIKLIEKLKLRSVISWTTDAPFRETKEEVVYFQSKGVDCVEMESAALMAAGDYYGLDVFCMGVVSDQLSVQGWRPRFSHPDVKKSLYALLSEVLFL